jgi:hypothetical protein
MIVKKTATFGAGEWAPTLDGRGDLDQYDSACRTLTNFIGRPQGGLCKRPGMEYRGKLQAGATDGKAVEFELKGTNSIILGIAGGKMKFFKDGSPIQFSGADLTLNVPWTDGTLSLLRWKQINDVMMFVHPDQPPKILTRTSDTVWDLSNFVPGRRHAFLPDNLDSVKRITASFPLNVDFTTWSNASVAYKVGDRVKRTNVFYSCEKAHTSSNSNKPEDKPTFLDADEEENRLIWTKEFVDRSSTNGQEVTLTSNKALWTAEHVGAYWELAHKRGLWDFEARLAVDKGATGTTKIYSKVLTVQGNWTAQTFGNWNGKFYVQISRDRGTSWQNLRAVQSTALTPRNTSFEGNVPVRAMLRLAFDGYGPNGTSGSPYAVLNVEGAYLRGIVKITEFTNSKSVKAVTLTPIEKDTTDVWAEGAWSDNQGYPRCIEFHQNRVILAATNKSPHTIWGSADDDYNNFQRGALATDPWAHTVMIGQREPISWLMSDRQLVIGSSVGVFSMFGADQDKPITPEDRNVIRQNSTGSHVQGPGVMPADAAALFVEHGGRIVRELAYSFQSDRYETGNLNLYAEHLFTSAQITDFAIQRYPLQVIWFVAGGQLFSLCYEKMQKVAGWQRHPTAGTVLSVACIRKSAEDEVWLVMNHGTGAPTMERFHPGAMTTPVDDGYWSDCCSAMTTPYSLTGHPLAGLTVVGWNNGNKIGPATLNSGFFTGLSGPVIVGRPYTSTVEPLTPEVPLQNGTSRTRELRIHAAAVSLYRSRGGKLGETPAGTAFDPLKVGAIGSLFTGEKEVRFEGSHNTAGAFCIVSEDPFPFWIRSVTLKFNVYGDDR